MTPPTSTRSGPLRAGAACAFLGALAGALLTASGCLPHEGDGGDGDPAAPCEPSFVGDASLSPELQIVQRTADGEMIDGVEMGPVDLFLPPQGGKVFLTAARVRNVQVCGLRVEAWLRDECTGRVIGLEGRPYQTRLEDGWLVPREPGSLSSWSNVAGCPSQAAVRRIDGEVYELNVRVIDRDDRRGVATLHVVPRCTGLPYRLRQCRCECGPDYELGDTCEGGDSDVSPGGDAGPPVLQCPGTGGDP